MLCLLEIQIECKVCWWKLFGEEKCLGDDSERNTIHLIERVWCSHKLRWFKILGEKEKKNNLQRFIVELCIIMAMIMREIRKVYMNFAKNRLDFLYTTEIKENKWLLMKSPMRSPTEIVNFRTDIIKEFLAKSSDLNVIITATLKLTCLPANIIS